MAAFAEFPAFIRAKYDRGNAFAEFTNEARQASDTVARHFKGSMEEVSRITARALSMPRGQGGALDLGVGEMRQAAQVAEQQAAALRQVANAAEAVAAKRTQLSAAEQAGIAAAVMAANAADGEAMKLREKLALYEQLQRELGETAAATNLAGGATSGLAGVTGQSTGALRSNQMAMIGAGQQLQDMVIGLQSGQRATIVFSQQVPQLAFALSNMEGKLGTVARFLAGPWGAAIFIATGVLGGLVGSLISSRRETERTAQSVAEAAEELRENAVKADQARRAQELFGRSLPGVTEAIRSETEALREQNRTLGENQALTLQRAQQQAGRLQRLLNVNAADQAAAIARVGRLEARAGRYLAGPRRGEIIESVELRQARDELARLRAENAAIHAQIRGAADLVNLAGIDIAERRAEGLADPVALLNQRFDDMAAAARRAAEGNAELTGSLAEQLAAIERQREAAVRAEEERQERARRAPREAQRAREALYREARARAEAAGFRISRGFSTPEENRAVGGVARSRHLTYQALDIGLGPGVTRESIRRAFAGFNIVELLGPGDPGHADHFHVAWSGAMEGVGGAADELSESLRRLLGDLAAFTREFEPGRAAALDYADALERIARLEQGGLIDSGTAERWRGQALVAHIEENQRLLEERMRATLSQLSPSFQRATEPLADSAFEGLTGAGRAGGEAFRDAGLDAVSAIVDAFGGSMRDEMADVVAFISGDLSKMRTGVGRIVAQFLTPPTADDVSRYAGHPLGSVIQPLPRVVGPFESGMREILDPMRNTLKDLVGTLDDAFGSAGAFTAALGRAGGGAAVGTLTAAFGKQFWDKFSTTGAQLGGALGAQLGPLGALAGSVIGGTIGGLMKSTPRASTTIVGADGRVRVASTTGSRRLRGGTETAADSVIASVERIAELLGGNVMAGVGRVSIGVRDGNYRVDPTGRGITKTKKGAIDFGEDAEAAIRAAVLDLIRDGVIAGLRAGTQRLLQSAKDLDAGIDKALKFEGVFIALQERLDPVGAAIEALDKRFAGLKRVFDEAGASAEEYAQLEQLYSLEREDAIKAAGERMTSALRGLLDDLTVSNDARGLRERLAMARAAYDPLAAKVAAGERVDYETFADAARQVEALQRQIYGSTQPYFELLDNITDLTTSALARQQELIDAAAARDPAISPAASEPPTVTAIDRLGDLLVDELGGRLDGHLSAVNDNLGSLIQLAVAGGGRAVQPFPDFGRDGF